MGCAPESTRYAQDTFNFAGQNALAFFLFAQARTVHLTSSERRQTSSHHPHQQHGAPTEPPTLKSATVTAVHTLRPRALKMLDSSSQTGSGSATLFCSQHDMPYVRHRISEVGSTAGKRVPGQVAAKEAAFCRIEPSPSGVPSAVAATTRFSAGRQGPHTGFD